ncbi:MAG: zinc ribbon domain-containing protein [Propioniciclava sp.]|uniref:zinc ribbon domain-containing protein n=1 Tax=Propioniciclava sp. TaxID=2038686 RepID=UPI0039E2A8E0
MTVSGSAVHLFGTPFVCRVCGHDRFIQREIKMQTTGLTFLDLDWLNRSADGVICSRCGYVHMFAGGVHEWIG